MKKRENNKGITLIALVITIIVLIILAGVSINLIIGEDGIIAKASAQKIEQEIAQVTETLELKKADVAIKNTTGGVSIDDYIEEIQNDEKMLYKVTKVDKVDKVDQKNAYITVEGKYEYLLEQEENGNLKITFEGEVEKLKPRIQNIEVKTTTNKIEIKVEATRVEKYVFYIKGKEEAEYVKKEENTTGKCIFENLTENKEYSIKVEVINRIGKDEREIDRTTVEMANLTQEEVQYIKSETNWTNKNVTTTIEMNTEKDISNYEIQYTKFEEGTEVTSESLRNVTWIKYEASGIISEENEIIYSRLYDGYNTTSYTSTTIANIDTVDPIISTELNSSDVTAKGFTLNIGVTDAISGLGKIVWNYKLSTADSYTSVEEVYTDLNGSTAGETTAVTKSKAFDELTNGTYNAYAVIYNVAGNSIQSQTIEIRILVNEVGTVWNYNYTGGVQSFTATDTGIYKLEVFGGQGGGAYAEDFGTALVASGGNGGYATGNIALNKDNVITITVGGQGNNSNSGNDRWHSGATGGTGGTTSISLSGTTLIYATGGGGGHFEGWACGGCDTYDHEDWSAHCVSYNGGSGSGYIGGVTSGSIQNGIRSGNGYARITFVSQ